MIIIRAVFSLAVLALAGVLMVALSGHLWGRYQEETAALGFGGVSERLASQPCRQFLLTASRPKPAASCAIMTTSLTRSMKKKWIGADDEGTRLLLLSAKAASMSA